MPISSFTTPSTPLPSNSTILITGGSGGIGLSTAQLLSTPSLNNKIALLDLQPPRSLPSTLTPSNHIFIPCDITSWPSQRSAFSTAAKKFNGIDHVFVNAGIAERGDQFFSQDLDENGELAEPERGTVDVCLRAACDTVRLAVFWLRKREGRSRSIVLTASLAGYLASAGAPLYSAAKHGLVGLMRALKNDLATLDIAISVVAPGITLTEIVAGRKPGQSLHDWAVDMRGRGVPINGPDDVARAVVWLMGQGMQSNGMGLVIQEGRCADVEKGIATSRKEWMGEDMLGLFRRGRNAPLFPNKLEAKSGSKL